MVKTIQGELTAQDKRFALIVSRFNELIGSKLLDGAMDCLNRHDVNENNVTVYWVPGAFEIPLVAKKAAESGSFDAVICLGAVIRGETPHFDFVAVRFIAERTTCKRSNPFHGHPPPAPPAPLEMFVL